MSQRILLVALLLLLSPLTFGKEKKVLMVVTSHSDLGNTGRKIGFWLPELTHPYYEFTKVGLKVDVASIQGGVAPIDNDSFKEPDSYNDKFLKDAGLMSKVLRSIPLKSVRPEEYDAIVFAGGSGAMYDFPKSIEVRKLSQKIYEKGGVVAAICHGPAALVNIKLSNGKYLIDGKKVTGFTNEEEKQIGQYDILPFLLEDRLQERGGKFLKTEAWKEKVVVDERLVTGQNPASSKKVAFEVIKLLK